MVGQHDETCMNGMIKSGLRERAYVSKIQSFTSA